MKKYKISILIFIHKKKSIDAKNKFKSSKM